MMSQPGNQIFAINILHNISGSNDNQTIRYADIFLEKSFTKSGEKTIPRPFHKRSKLSIFPDQ